MGELTGLENKTDFESFHHHDHHGMSALASVLIAWAFIIPSMEHPWFKELIAHYTGDLGFEFSVLIVNCHAVRILTLLRMKSQ